MRRLAAAALTAAALLVAATPAAADGDHGDAGGDPCHLLRRKEISRVLGQQAGPPTRSLGPMFCQWTLAATPTRAPGQVNTLLGRGKAASRDYRLGRDLAGARLEPVDGLGKKAFFTPETGTLFVLAAGPTLYYVQANLYDADANRLTEGLKDLLVALARRAEARV